MCFGNIFKKRYYKDENNVIKFPDGPQRVRVLEISRKKYDEKYWPQTHQSKSSYNEYYDSSIHSELSDIIDSYID